ncbi:MAG: winged helix-turn-helix domain-containing protein [Nocardioides sp.]|nr:winged helix-turn-helix domain-containing protein [Nocardioides sp.]
MTTTQERRLRSVPNRKPKAPPQQRRQPFVREPVGDQTWCQANSHIYLSLQPPSWRAAPAQVAAYEKYTGMARDWCANRCPLFAECLRDALSGPGMEGFVAGTTETERERLRETAGITQATFDSDEAAGTYPAPLPKPEPGKGYDLSATAAAVAAEPDATYAELAERLGMAEVTVKRHCRKLRAAEASGHPIQTAPATESDTELFPVDVVHAYRAMFRTA